MVTFKVPCELREVLRVQRRAGYEALFAASSQSLLDVAGATKSLRGSPLGFFGVLHTWGRDPMVYHPHVHYLVPGGGVVLDLKGNTRSNTSPLPATIHPIVSGTRKCWTQSF